MARTESAEQVAARLTAPGAPFAVVRAEDGTPSYASGPRTLREFAETTWAYADRPFLISESGTLGYGDFFAAASALARRLADDYGLAPGDRAAIVMRNHPEWQVAFWAAQLAGLVAVPLNAWWTPTELAYALDDCTPRVLLVDGERLPAVDSWRRRSGARCLVFHASADALPEGVERYEDLGAPDPSAAPPDVDVPPEADATIFYTSGTTGRPRGAVATHLAQAGAAVHPRFHAAASALGRGLLPGQGADPVALMTFPFFHVAAFTTVYSMMGTGGAVVLMRKWDAEEALALIARHRVTHYSGVPTTAVQLLEAAERTGADLATVTNLGTGGAPPPPGLVARLTAAYGRRIEPRNGYGLTETSGGVLAAFGDAYREDPACVGLPAPAIDVRIAGPGGAAVPAGQAGELWLRGQGVVRGYWRDERATAEAFREGWFMTGDVAVLTEGGVRIVDRVKDVILRGGENVYCGEVERELLGHPDVAECAVLGVPHAHLGEEVAAVVRLRPGATAGPAELRRHAARDLAAYKVPARVVLADGPLPRNAAGKVLKRRLRRELHPEGPRPDVPGADAGEGGPGGAGVTSG
ncbi:class I adenylate-forming enzyme family protein [Streptomyces sp. C10-9-1]|uniref:class I adenylate-forming enzyme family protein n=1 Tax=Streptomyces sp. C10-9-1 TaxID=1859285 RepID=UPI003D7629E1